MLKIRAKSESHPPSKEAHELKTCLGCDYNLGAVHLSHRNASLVPSAPSEAILVQHVCVCVSVGCYLLLFCWAFIRTVASVQVRSILAALLTTGAAAMASS